VTTSRGETVKVNSQRGAGTEPILELKSVSVSYGNIAAVQDLSLRVYPDEIVTLIGSNGAGKSTTLRTISGLLRPMAGEVIYKGRGINGMPGHEVVKLGICHSPEGRKIFHRMTVSENLDLGAFVRKDSAKIAEDREWVLELFPPLQERIDQKAGTLSGGEQQMLAVARALMLRPKLMLLDEPSFGLAPLIIEELFEILKSVNRESRVSLLLVEQNADLALEIADHAYLVETGRIVTHGPAAEIRADEGIRRAYLGY
jgi:branched-chain amino acid transport system ATP-binding protein